VIISHLHRFVFVKTRKTAGTSLEIALSSVCGDTDVVTPISEDEHTSRVVGPQNTRVPISSRAIVDATLHRRWPAFYNHMSAVDGRRYMRFWNKYFTFTVERNPWDRAVSMYHFRIRNLDNPPTFSEFLRGPARSRLSNFPTYTDRGQVIVNRVIRFERLADDFAELWRLLRLPGVPMLTRAKSGYRRPLVMSESDVGLIADLCHREIALFGYAPPPELCRRV